ncbi:ComF family protein [Oleiagrimonas sp.]|jgi:ComF family protein|uniref:ComF family protein n=1 Tax=Oleiagrimonas sp. TaxID=2010330 RepID=UPI00262864BF|nr:ComF family protein [Oleiagrimonas sp.]MDA3915060.1 ComF family protein [Oleiagrimonas sp.]
MGTDAFHLLKRHGEHLLCHLLPPRCLLCGAPGEKLDLCAACRDEIPLNTICCGSCALPLDVAAAQCGACLVRAPRWDSAWAPFRYGWPLDRLESRYKFSGHLAAGRVLGRLWAAHPLPARPDLIVPVPLHHGRLRQRGYNQSLELARVLARAHGLDLRHDLLRRVRPTTQQTRLSAVQRRRNVRGAFQLAHGDGLPRHVAVIDDVMTTGATLNECARVLKRGGVEQVDVWALARAPQSRARQG